MAMQSAYEHIPGWGYDRVPENRPGVPKNRDPARPVGHAHWAVPAQQTTERASLVSPTRSETSIYSSSVPPRGLSGALRRAAYHVPEYRPRRWMMLLLADRVDAVEHSLPRAALFVAGASALVWGWLHLARRGAASEAAAMSL